MYRLTAKYHATTPLFLAGADQRTAELRLPSIKGLVRYWWRALKYAECAGDLDQLRGEEAGLFGSTERQAVVRFRLADVTVKSRLEKGETHAGLAKLAGTRYLGYGVVRGFGAKQGQLDRGCIDGCRFALHCLSRRPFPQDFVRTLKFLGLLGGLGSKSRKGYGSLTLEALAGDHDASFQRPGDSREYALAIRDLLAGTSSPSLPQPEITAFSPAARIDLLHEAPTALDLLDEYGRMMQRYRSWGQSSSGNLVNGQPSEKRFKDDHDWSKQTAHTGEFHPRRVVFGLPHNYYVDRRSIKVEPADHTRRASPLFYHVHDYGNGRFAGIAFILPSQFLPEGERINAGGNIVVARPDFGILTQFLDAKIRNEPGKDTETPYFPNRQTLWPVEEGA